jgi:hypothetical protein
MFIYKTSEELEALSTTELDQYKADLKKHEAELQKKAINDEVKAQLAKAQEDLKTFLGTEIANQIAESKPKNGRESEKSFLEVVKENRKGIDESTKERGSGREHEFVIKADTVRPNVAGNPYALDLGQNTLPATRKLTVYDLFPKIPVGKNMNGVVRYVEWDLASINRAANAIAEGTVFPESTAKWITNTLPIQKVGTSIPISEEFAYDDEMFVAEVANFIVNDVDIKIDTDLVNGNGTSPNIKGILAQCPTYTAAASGIVDASIYDLIVDVKRSITAGGGSKFQPDFALMNIVDINKMLLKKDGNKNYVSPPFVSNGQTGTAEFVVAGVRVVECNAMAANTMVVGCSPFAKIYEETGMTVATGYDGSDWTLDMMTLKARKRLNLLIRTQDQFGFAKVASISAALTLLAT